MAARSLALTFLGATSTITGARYLLDAGHARVLVDCGLYQGFKQLRLRNRAPFLTPPGSTDCSQHDQAPQLDAIVLTHAHLDHSGFLPRLCRAGFRGPVYCTAGTAALCGLLLPDSAALQLHDAAFANKKGYSKSHPATPLYDLEDAAQAVRQLVPTPFGERFNLPGGLQGSFTRAGHMLGAASLRVDDGVRRVLFSGDLGREQDIMMAPPESRPQADIVVLESTYGGRAHDGEDPAEALADLIRRTATRGGRVLIPAFAFGMILKTLFSGTSDQFYDWFPIGGFRSENWNDLSWWEQVKDQTHHMFLPVLCYVIGNFAVLTILMKNSLLDQIAQDYVRTVLAKGGTMRRAVWLHALRNAIIPIVTGIGGILSIMFAGSVLIERVFAINGIGLLTLDAIVGRDYMVFMGTLALTAIVGLVGRVLSDFCYVLVDPRISFGGES